jgi:Fe-S cluster assembly iron-binding protein IscA
MVLDEPGKEDEVVLLEGISFVYHRNDEGLLNHSYIDYKDSWYGEGFVICSPASEPC